MTGYILENSGLIEKRNIMNKKDLENRLIEFSVSIAQWVDSAGKHPVIIHLRDQIIRSGTAPALNYAEAQSAESKRDFIHKLGIVLKELRETQVNLRIIRRLMPNNDPEVEKLLRENDELLAIFHTTIMTAKSRL